MSETTLEIPKWSVLERIGFRFSFIYFALFIVIQNNGAYPFWYFLIKKPTDWLHHLIPWFGKNVLKLSYEITTFTNGSGDTSYDYVLVLVIFLAAVIGTLVWSVFDRKRCNYKKMYYWLTVAIRFYVALMLINYGLVKVIQLQFSSPSFYRLIQPYGDSSPMGLAWTFLGFSKGYNLFMGIAEVAAVLLLFRRTMTLGAIITLMTTTNVMAVNYFYDVPVKILSTHLVMMTLFLLAYNFKDLFKFFFTRNAISLTIIEQPKKEGDKSLQLVSRIIKGVVIVYALGFGFSNVLSAQKLYGSKAPKPALFGLHKVTNFEINGDTVDANVNDSKRWQYLIFERKGSIRIQKTDKSSLSYKTIADSINQTLKLTSYQDTTDTFVIDYMKTDSTLAFKTIFKGDTIKGNCSTRSKENFILTSRGFNWINEYPFNK